MVATTIGGTSVIVTSQATKIPSAANAPRSRMGWTVDATSDSNPTIVIVVSFFSGIQLLSLGIMGEYVGRIYDETRARPRYIVESSYGWEESPGDATGA